MLDSQPTAVPPPPPPTASVPPPPPTASVPPPTATTVPITASVAGVSTAGRRFGKVVAQAALSPTPLSRISEGSNESSSRSGVRGGEVGGVEKPTQQTNVDKVRSLASRALGNNFAVASLVFLLTATLLCVLNPPMAQKPSDNPAAPPVRSFQKILVWSSLASVFALLLPYGVCLVKKGN